MALNPLSCFGRDRILPAYHAARNRPRAAFARHQADGRDRCRADPCGLGRGL